MKDTFFLFHIRCSNWKINKISADVFSMPLNKITLFCFSKSNKIQFSNVTSKINFEMLKQFKFNIQIHVHTFN